MFAVLAGIFAFATISNLVVLGLDIVPKAMGLTYAVPFATVVLALVLGALPFRLRRKPRSLRELRALDAGATIFSCWAIGVLFARLPSSNEIAIASMLAGTYVIMARSIALPSSGRRTLAISLAAMVPMGLCAAAVRSMAAGRGPLQANLFDLVAALRPVAVTTFLASIASQVIYGLRREIRETARIGQYLLREKIGQGGMGVVYRATHALLRRDTAIKLLSPERVGADNLARFEREVKLTAQLTHPNTVAVFDYGRTPDGIFYYAMEYLAGGDLDELVDYAGPQPPGRVICILEQVCRALREAHGLGLVHRDIKPNNILLCERGLEGDVVKVVDFGLVKDLNAAADAGATIAGAMAGTPHYISPEAVTARAEIDARADLYSLGAVGYFLLVGEPVFSGNTIVEVCAHHLHSSPTPPCERRPDVPADLEAVILRCLAKRPEDRFAGAGEMRDALLGCRAAGSWTPADSAAWWGGHRSSFRAKAEARRWARLSSADGAIKPGARAIAIDFQQRSPRQPTGGSR